MCIAAFVQGVIGFGFGLSAMAAVPAVLGVQGAVAVVALLATTVNLLVLIKYRRAFERRVALPLLVGAVLGAPLGLLVIRDLSGTVAFRVLGGLLVLHVLYQATRKKTVAGFEAERSERFDLIALPIGFCSGVLGTAFNTGGPPAVMYGSARHWAPELFKCTLQALFLTISAVQVPLLIGADILDGPRAAMAAWLLPALLVGLFIGTRLADRMPARVFERVLLGVLLLVGVYYLVR